MQRRNLFATRHWARLQAPDPWASSASIVRHQSAAESDGSFPPIPDVSALSSFSTRYSRSPELRRACVRLSDEKAMGDWYARPVLLVSNIQGATKFGRWNRNA